MNAPTKCEAVRRALVIADDLADLDALSAETTVLFKEFDPIRWRWYVVVSHDVLTSLAPGQVCTQYGSVAFFNRMIEQQIAKAIAGELVAEADTTLSLYGLALAQYQAAQAQLGQQYYPNSGTQAPSSWVSTGATGNLSQLGQYLGGQLGQILPPPTSTGGNTP